MAGYPTFPLFYTDDSLAGINAQQSSGCPCTYTSRPSFTDIAQQFRKSTILGVQSSASSASASASSAAEEEEVAALEQLWEAVDAKLKEPTVIVSQAHLELSVACLDMFVAKGLCDVYNRFHEPKSSGSGNECFDMPCARPGVSDLPTTGARLPGFVIHV